MPLGLTASELSPTDAPETAPGVHSGFPDPSVIARMANAFFQMTPNQNGVGADPGVPVAPPSPAMIPAPNLVTSVAPFTPANPMVGPPDLPPSTIPSVVPTPNLTAPHAPTLSALPPGFGQPPMPGASAGSVGPEAAPGRLGDASPLVPFDGEPFDSRAGAPASDVAYFLGESPLAGARPDPFSKPSAPSPNSASLPAATAPQFGGTPSRPPRLCRPRRRRAPPARPSLTRRRSLRTRKSQIPSTARLLTAGLSTAGWWRPRSSPIISAKDPKPTPGPTPFPRRPFLRPG